MPSVADHAASFDPGEQQAVSAGRRRNSRRPKSNESDRDGIAARPKMEVVEPTFCKKVGSEDCAHRTRASSSAAATAIRRRAGRAPAAATTRRESSIRTREPKEVLAIVCSISINVNAGRPCPEDQDTAILLGDSYRMDVQSTVAPARCPDIGFPNDHGRCAVDTKEWKRVTDPIMECDVAATGRH